MCESTCISSSLVSNSDTITLSNCGKLESETWSFRLARSWASSGRSLFSPSWRWFIKSNEGFNAPRNCFRTSLTRSTVNWTPLSTGIEVVNTAATKEPAEAPPKHCIPSRSLFPWRWRHETAPKWYMPWNPQPANDIFMTDVILSPHEWCYLCRPNTFHEKMDRNLQENLQYCTCSMLCTLNNNFTVVQDCRKRKEYWAN